MHLSSVAGTLYLASVKSVGNKELSFEAVKPLWIIAPLQFCRDDIIMDHFSFTRVRVVPEADFYPGYAKMTGRVGDSRKGDVFVPIRELTKFSHHPRSRLMRTCSRGFLLLPSCTLPSM